MKKLLLTLGTVASVAAPIAAVVSCGSETKTATHTFDKNAGSETTSQNYYSEYKMRDIGEMGTASRTALNTILSGMLDSNGAVKTITDLKTAVNGSTLSPTEQTMINKIADHYDSGNGNAEKAYHILHFALASTDPQQISTAVLGWVYNGQSVLSAGDQSIIAPATEEIKNYIFNGTLDIKEIASSIISKFKLEDKHFAAMTLQLAFKLDPVAKTFTQDIMASQALVAMGGEETLKFILHHGAGWTLLPKKP